MRPQVRFLTNPLIQQIISEARSVLSALGVEIHNDRALGLLADHGARVDRQKSRAFINEALIDRSLAGVPKSFKLFDSAGKQTNNFTGDTVHFTPGSSGLNYLPPPTQTIRPP